MPRARNIKPSFFKNEDLAALDPLARLLFAGLWVMADRDGRLEDRPKRIKAEILPYDDCDVDIHLAQLHKSGFIRRYEVDGVKAIQITCWTKHVRPFADEASFDLPLPPQCSHEEVVGSIDDPQSKSSLSSSSTSSSSLPSSTDTSPPPGDVVVKKTFKKPTVEEVREYCLERKNGIDPEVFVAFYDSNGWKVGRNAMKDWRAAVRTWENNRKQSPPARASPSTTYVPMSQRSARVGQGGAVVS